jgi:hypothetical protein
MKRLAPLLALPLIFLATTTILRAQIPPPPTPTPDPHNYSDPAMNFTAPADAYLLGRHIVSSPDQLGEDLSTVAAWVLHPGKEDARMIQLQMEAYDGPPDQWEAQFESQTHGAQDGTLIKNKTHISLLNGMPAYFVEVTYGSGFDSRKEYAVVWADGQRGIVLSEVGRLGDATEDEAKTVLKDVTAVRYPTNQP